jgi:hypothetical protein
MVIVDANGKKSSKVYNIRKLFSPLLDLASRLTLSLTPLDQLLEKTVLSRFCQLITIGSKLDLMVNNSFLPSHAIVKAILILTPSGGFGYAWPNENLHWQDLVKRPSRAILCKNSQGESFRFQAYTVHDKGDPSLRFVLPLPCHIVSLKADLPHAITQNLPSNRTSTSRTLGSAESLASRY